MSVWDIDDKFYDGGLDNGWERYFAAKHPNNDATGRLIRTVLKLGITLTTGQYRVAGILLSGGIRCGKSTVIALLYLSDPAAQKYAEEMGEGLKAKQ